VADLTSDELAILESMFDLARRGDGAAQLRRIPEVVAIAYGTRKAPAVHAALSGGLVGGLVTHRALAEVLVAGIDAVPARGGSSR
jgi:hypothetical protein